MTDLDRIPGFEPRGAGGLAREAWTVAALLAATGELVGRSFGAVAVRGELGGSTRAASGHCYFTLKDAAAGNAALRCVMFRRAAMLCSVPLQDGVQVEVRGRLAVYEARGELQMVVESVQRLGAGQLYEEFLRLRARLEAEGLFDATRKRPLPAFVRRVGVVTSTAGAALHDVLSTLRRRAPHVGVVIYPSAVQGPDAPAALVAALRMAQQRDEVDAVIVCRGGGSLEDLWAFNDERVVRAVAASNRPIVSGVGHETDVSLVDLAADLRAATPTAAAEAVAAERGAWLEALDVLAGRMQARVHRSLEATAQRLDTAALRLARPASALGAWRDRLQRIGARHHAAWQLRRQALRAANEAAGHRMVHAADRRLGLWRERLGGQARALAALDPRRVLERGFALLESATGHALVSARQLQAGDEVRAVMHDGRAGLRVQSVELALPRSHDDGAGGPPLAAPP